ncbi:outer membrane lipoprotein chaperone LolA [Pontibacterium granulatum]|nr:outer membrane lipoprotein chaperone LolA [Pontibacterium granulatum]
MMITFLKKACLTAALVVSAAGTATFAQAETASEKLKALLDGYSTFSAEFSQIASADQGGRVQESTGSLQVAKPNKFRWTSNEPYPQIIVGDGTYIWVHDPDLEQVTRKPAQNGTTSAPALILNGQIEELEQQFNIAGGQVSDLGGQLFELIPLTEQNTFKRIRLFFAGEKISELMLEDTLGQRTTIVFQNQQINPEFSANQFQFVLPEGADLILDSEI